MAPLLFPILLGINTSPVLNLKYFDCSSLCVIHYLHVSFVRAIKVLVRFKSSYGSPFCPPYNAVDLSSLLGFVCSVSHIDQCLFFQFFVPPSCSGGESLGSIFLFCVDNVSTSYVFLFKIITLIYCNA